MLSLSRALALTLATLIATPVLAADMKHDMSKSPMGVFDVWARASAGPAKVGGAFMMLHNHTKKDDALVAASTPVAGRVELHTHIMDGTVMQMRRVDTIDVAADAKVMLQPGGLHVMLFDLAAPLKEGQTFPLTLMFKKAGKITTTVTVKKVATMKHNMDHGNMDHGNMDHSKMKHSKMKH